jgi:hypothetical protein
MPYTQPSGSPYDSSIRTTYKTYDLGSADSLNLSNLDVRVMKATFIRPLSNKTIKPCLKYPSTLTPRAVKSKCVRFPSAQLETVRLFMSTERPNEIHAKVPFHNLHS